MISQRSRRTISNIYDAALAPDLWPAALQSVMDEAGAVGAGYSHFNKRTDRDEWYNDYLLRAGIDDALSARLCESASHVVVFAVSHGNDRAPFTAAGTATLQELLEPLAKAARLH